MKAESLSKATDNLAFKVQSLSSYSLADFVDSDHVVELFNGVRIKIS